MDWNSIFGIKVVAALHILFAMAEVFGWTYLTPLLGIYTGEHADKQAEATAAVGKNMGVYNGILAACLIWLVSVQGLTVDASRSAATLFLSSIVCAGLFGGFTIKWTIPIFQSLPAAIVLGLVWRSAVHQ